MKYGHSILLSETIEAVRLEYPDCRAFQVVCPMCREPIFKGVREQPAVVHYLSHYGAASAYAAECELRVGRFDAGEIERQNLSSRGQRLELFLRVLRDMIKRFEYRNAREKTETLFRMLERSKPIGFLRDVFVENVAKNAPGASLTDRAVFTETADYYINEDAGSHHAMWRTGFGLQTQKRIAYDLWCSLCTPACKPNLLFLFNHGYATLLGRLQASLDQGWIDEPSRQLRRYAEKLVQSSRTGGIALIVEMGNRPTPTPFAIPGSNYLNKLISEVNHEMIGCLLRLPYFEVLKEHQTP
jgi:hypothetical protein